MKRTMLKRKSSLRLKSLKQLERDAEWFKVKLARAQFLAQKYNKPICEYCGRPSWGNELGLLDAHHIDLNRRNNTEDNCYLCHRVCHGKIHDNNIRVKQLGFEGIKNGENDE